MTTRRMAFFITACILAVAASYSPTQDHESNSLVTRGEYLTLHVAMCVQCHTPRDADGNLLSQSLLMGAPMPVQSPYPEQPWAFEAPKLAGLPAGFSEDEFVHLLMAGKDFRGRSPRPPMPPFRMNREDAAAVAAYLKSLQ